LVWIHRTYTPSAWRRAPKEAINLLWVGSRFIVHPEDEPTFIFGSTLYGTYIIQGKLLVIRINNIKTTMAILLSSWTQHLKSLAGNDEANKNMKAFSDAFAPSTTVAERVAALVERRLTQLSFSRDRTAQS
jgi:hypothetical protein